MKQFLTFPNPVDDAAARTVALGVVAMSALALFFNAPWILVPLTYGFLARVAHGPHWSPLGQFATRVAAPRLTKWHKFVAGPPKRFAQGVGAVLTVSACVLWATEGWLAARWLLVPLMIAAALEGFAGFCLGCTVFGWLMRWGVIPDSVCLECSDLTARYTAAGYPPR